MAATVEFNSHIDLNFGELQRAALQNFSAFPSTSGANPGWIIWHTVNNTAYCWTGSDWLDLGSLYTHPTFSGASQPAAALSGATVISRILLTNGHVTGVETRALTPTDIGAAPSSHTHNFANIIGLPATTILGNKTAATGAAQALTAADLLVMLGLAYGDAATLSTGTDTAQRSWTAKQLTDWVTAKLSGYLTAVNLSYSAAASNGTINNSGGANVTLPAANSTSAGLMTSADKNKLDGIASGANNYVHPTDNPGSHPFQTELTSGLKVLSKMTVNSAGHVIEIKGRDLTAADIASVMIVAGTNTTSTNQTWSASTINTKIIDAIANATTGALQYMGEFNPVTNTPNITTLTTVKTGWTYVVSVNGTFLGQEVEAGDMIIAKTNNPQNTLSNWQLVNKNIPAIVAASAAVAGIIMLATTAEGIAGTDNTKAVTPAVLKAVLDARVGGYGTDFGDGSSTSFTITHGLNTKDVTIVIYRNSDNKEIQCGKRANAVNAVLIELLTAPATNAYRAVIKK